MYQGTKEGAVNQGTYLVQEASKQAHQLLDATEALVDRILPPDMEFEYQEVTEHEAAEAVAVTAAPEGNPLPRATALGAAVPRRLKAAALSKIRTLDLKNATQIEVSSVQLLVY